MMRSCLQDAVHAVLIVALSIAPIFLTQTLFVFTTQIQFETKVMKKESYSMLGDDWPPFYPLELKRKVEMVVEESVHYYARVRVRRRGAARLGDENRTFAVSLYHQTHCLLNLHAQLAISSPSSSSPPIIDDDDRRPRYAHLQHCLNYLRQQALCHPDLTLEAGDFAKRDFDVGRQGETHMCRDFETAWDHNTLRWLEWHRFLNEKSDANDQ